MDGLSAASSIVSVIQLAEEVGKLCYKYVTEVLGAREDIRQLQLKVKALHDVLEKLQQGCQSSRRPLELSESTQEAIADCKTHLRELRGKLSKSAGGYEIAPGVLNGHESADDSHYERFKAKLRRSPDRSDTGRSKSPRPQKAMSRVGLRSLKWPFSRSEVHEEVERLEGWLAIFTISVGLEQFRIAKRIDSRLEAMDYRSILRELSYLGEATFNSNDNLKLRRCLPGTRAMLLEDIFDWLDWATGQSIFWLRGMAGTGKSTIAMTVADHLSTQDVYLATFFFKRGKGGRDRADQVVTTIAYQFATQSHEFHSHLAKVIDKKPHLGKESTSLSEQYDELLIKPLRALKWPTTTKPTFIIVLDALDECEDVNDIRSLLRLFGKTEDMASLQLRLITTSRPETSIKLGFHEDMPGVMFHTLKLDDISREVVDKDIMTYFTCELEEIRSQRRLAPDWVTKSQLKTLVERAAGLFIFASTACLYVRGPSKGRPPNSLKRLKEVCQGSTGQCLSTVDIDKMYQLVLESSMQEDNYSDVEREEIMEDFQAVVGSIVLLFDNLSVKGLSAILSAVLDRPIDEYQEIIRLTLDPLYAVMDVPEDDDDPIRMLHLSFRDFLIDPGRCSTKYQNFCIKEASCHKRLAMGCLNTMTEALHENMCQLRSSGTLLTGLDKSSMSEEILPELQYACRYWFDHAQKGELELDDHGTIHTFLEKHFLHWIEALSLLGHISVGVSTISTLEGLVDTINSPRLHELVYNARRFLLTHSSIISQAPLQAYTSALVFSPYTSILRKLFPPKLPHGSQLQTQTPQAWNECLQVLEGHTDWIDAIAFSLDGLQIATGSNDTTIRLWDSKNGECLHTFRGHTGRISDLAFFSKAFPTLISTSSDHNARTWDTITGDCRDVVTGHTSHIMCLSISEEGLAATASDDNTVRVWEVQSARSRFVLRHKSPVKVVKFHSNGSLIASGSEDCIVRIWDVKTGSCQHTFLGHTDAIRSLDFSPFDASLMVSASGDSTIRIWDINTGNCLHTLAQHTNWVSKTLFLPPIGSEVVSASYDRSIRIWDSKTGQCRHVLEGHKDWITQMDFSEQTSVLVTGADDYMARTWDVRSGKCLRVLEGHTSHIHCTKFSPDGTQLATGSIDKTVRLWDNQITEREDETIQGHSGKILITELSPDKSCVASAARDKDIRIWDSASGQCRHVLSDHTDYIRCIVFSLDGKHIATGGDDNTIRLWSIDSGKCEQIFQGHENAVTAITFNPVSPQFISGSDDSTVRIWDIEAGECKHTLRGHTGSVRSVAYSSDGTLLASVSYDATVRVWRSGSCQSILEGYEGDWFTSVAVSSDGSWIAAGTDGHLVHVWHKGEHTHVFEGDSGWTMGVSLSPNAHFIAGAFDDNTVCVWDLRSNEQVFQGLSNRSTPKILFNDAETAIIIDDYFSPLSLLHWDDDDDNQVSVAKLNISAVADEGVADLPMRIKKKSDWVTRGDERILWLPAEYRPVTLTQCRGLLVMGSENGKITFLHSGG